MTSADPKGQPVDTTRICYEGFMRVPEYEDPIAVRWYTIPRPGRSTFDLTEYSSCHWDDDTSVPDPPVGEQASTSTGRDTWRRCDQYPWNMRLDISGFHDMPEVPEGYTPGDWTHFNSPGQGWIMTHNAVGTWQASITGFPVVPGGPYVLLAHLDGSTVRYSVGLTPDTEIASGVVPYRLAHLPFELTDYDPAWEEFIRPIRVSVRSHPLLSYVAPDRWRSLGVVG